MAVEDAAERSRTLKAYEIPATVTAVMDVRQVPVHGQGAHPGHAGAQGPRPQRVDGRPRRSASGASGYSRASAGNVKRFLMDLLGALPFPLLSVQPAARSARGARQRVNGRGRGCPAGTAPHRRCAHACTCCNPEVPVQRLRGAGEPLGADRIPGPLRWPADRGARRSRRCTLPVLLQLRASARIASPTELRTSTLSPWTPPGPLGQRY